MKIQAEKAPSDSIVHTKIDYSMQAFACKPKNTGILEYFNINFAFQSFYIFIGTQDKNNFSIPVRES